MVVLMGRKREMEEETPRQRERGRVRGSERESQRGKENQRGAFSEKGVRRISMARLRHVWISLPSLQSLTLQQHRSGSNWEGEKKCPLILPGEINTYA